MKLTNTVRKPDMTSKLLRFALFLVSTMLMAQNPGPAGNAIPGHWEGRVAMRVEDDFVGHTSRTTVSLRTAQGALEIAPESVNPAWKPNQQIAIDGRRSGTRISVDKWTDREPQAGGGPDAAAQTTTATAPEAAAGTCSTTGQQNLAVLMLSFPNAPFPSYVTASMLQSDLFGPDPSTNGLISDSSYGLTSITGQIIGPISVPTNYVAGDFESAANAAGSR